MIGKHREVTFFVAKPNSSTSRMVYNVGYALVCLGMVGFLFMVYFDNKGISQAVLNGIVQYGIRSLGAIETMGAYLTVYKIHLLAIGGGMMLAGYLTGKPEDFSDLKNRGLISMLRKEEPQKPVRNLRVSQSHKHSQPVVRHVSTTSRCIRIENGDLAGRSFRFTDKLVIGRDPRRCDVVFPASSRGVSGVHCTLRLREGRVTVTDENATNGTYVDGRRIPGGTTVALHRGQRLNLGSGKCTLTLHS